MLTKIGYVISEDKRTADVYVDPNNINNATLCKGGGGCAIAAFTATIGSAMFVGGLEMPKFKDLSKKDKAKKIGLLAGGVTLDAIGAAFAANLVTSSLQSSYLQGAYDCWNEETDVGNKLIHS